MFFQKSKTETYLRRLLKKVLRIQPGEALALLRVASSLTVLRNIFDSRFYRM